MSQAFTIAAVQHMCYGHGDYGDELVIRQDSSGKFPPVFTRREDAEAYQTTLPKYPPTAVVPLELH